MAMRLRYLRWLAIGSSPRRMRLRRLNVGYSGGVDGADAINTKKAAKWHPNEKTFAPPR